MPLQHRLTLNYHHRSLLSLLFAFSYLACLPVSADTDGIPKNKAISIEFQTQKQEFKLNTLSFDNPALLPLSRAKDLIVVDGDVKTKGVKLDYRVKPYLNLFGSVAQSQGTALIKLSGIPNRALPDLKVNADGTTYSAGATLAVRDQDYFAALTYVHTLADMKSSSKTNTSYAVIPTIGKKTPVGTFSLGLRYQDAQSDYQGTLNIPVLGTVNTSISFENTNKVSYVAGFSKELGRDFYLRSHVEFGDREGARLEIGRRF